MINIQFLSDAIMDNDGYLQPGYGFLDEKSDVFVTDCHLSICHRFSVDPIVEYGMTPGDVEWMDMINAPYRKLLGDCRDQI